MTTPRKFPVGISSCLCGDLVRYDGSHQRDRFLTGVLGDYVDWVKTCPEEQAGLGTPRESLRLVKSEDGVRMVTNRSGVDMTEVVDGYSRTRVEELSPMTLRGYVLKSASPTCGMERVRVYTEGKSPSRNGVGLFARRLMERFPSLPVEEEGRLRDPAIRENFITRVFAYDRWLSLRESDPGPGDVVAFHTGHKMLLMAHSPAHYTEMGQLVAKAGVLPTDELLDRYETALMAGLREMATPGRHFNVLQHLAGFLKNELDGVDKEELHRVLSDYRLGQIPLVAPMLLLYHHIKHLRDDWLEAQIYLQPYPSELALRSYVLTGNPRESRPN